MEVSVYFTEYDEISAGGFDFQNDRFFSLCPEQIKQSIIRFRKPTDRMASYLGKRLLIQAIADYGIASDALNNYSLDDYKRPYIAKDFDFNISHSGNRVALIASSCCRVGIDVEKNNQIEIEEYQSCFTAEEWNAIIGSDSVLSCFYEYWTKKESVLKCNGTGLLREPATVSVFGEKAIIDGQEYYNREIELHKDYTCYVAFDKPFDNIRIIKF